MSRWSRHPREISRSSIVESTSRRCRQRGQAVASKTQHSKPRGHARCKAVARLCPSSPPHPALARASIRKCICNDSAASGGANLPSRRRSNGWRKTAWIEEGDRNRSRVPHTNLALAHALATRDPRSGLAQAARNCSTRSGTSSRRPPHAKALIRPLLRFAPAGPFSGPRRTSRQAHARDL